MERFGFFTTERAGYTREYGAVESARSHWINRHDLWAESHRRGADGERMRCSSDADCDDGRGSVCDLQWARAHEEDQGLCTIAYRDRQVDPIVYYLSIGFPTDLVQTAHAIV